MEALFVFFDGECGLCSKARTHLAGMAQHVPLIFVPYRISDFRPSFLNSNCWIPINR